MIVEEYSLNVEGMKVNVKIEEVEDLYIPRYSINIPGLAEGTKIILETQIKSELIGEVNVELADLLDTRKSKLVKQRFMERSAKVLLRHFPTLSKDKLKILSAYLMQYTLGLGDLEPFLHDEQLEEIVVNGSQQAVWVYHKKHGWCITNVKIKDEKTIQDYAAAIGRRVGRQINMLNPLMDARLVTGDRVNATLFPISTNGNTITIRKFSRNPWTPPMLIRSGTINTEVLAFLWLAIQNEMSVLISGGTGSGKTSFLNALSNLFPPNHRIVSIEDTREIHLPSFLQWVPLSTRLPNPEGKGEITMLDLMVNSLRMRPDRMIVGEVRRKREAEILFEAMHTGHSVYATLHANTAGETIARLVNPPIEIPQQMLTALDLISVQYRNRRTGIRRTFELAEVSDRGKAHVIYRWDPRKDRLEKVDEPVKIYEKIAMFTGWSDKEIKENIIEKEAVLKYLIDNERFDVETVGKIVAMYYRKRDELMDHIMSKGDIDEIL